MPEIEVPFATQAGESSVPQNSQEKLVNMYAEADPSGRKKIIRRQRAGLRSVLAYAGEKRAIEKFRGVHYAVIGDEFVSFDGSSTTLLGTIDTNTGRCSIIFDDNGKALISDGETGYTWDGSAISTLVMPDFAPVGTLAYQGGFGIIGVTDTARFYATALNDFTTVGALDFATAESFPDNTLRVFVDHNQLLLCGETSTEVWTLSGGQDLPFAPFTNGQIERGIIGSFAICAEDNTVFFIGNDKVAYRLNGYTPVRISTGPIERAILDVSAAAQAACEAFSYTSGGQKFITFRFPDELTIQFNLATGLWNYAQTFGAEDWKVLSSAGHMSDYLLTDAGFAQLDETLNEDEGETMLRLAMSAPGDANGKRITCHSLMLDVEVGRADINKDADVMLRVALDGETFGNVRTRSMGETGDYRRRVMYRNLGQGRKPAFEVSCSDDVRFSVMAAVCDLTVGAN